MPTFDTTIHVSDLIVLLGICGVAVKFMLAQRDFNRDIKTALWGQNGQPGLFKLVAEQESGLHKLKNVVHAVIVALAGKDISVDPH